MSPGRAGGPVASSRRATPAGIWPAGFCLRCRGPPAMAGRRRPVRVSILLGASLHGTLGFPTAWRASRRKSDVESLNTSALRLDARPRIQLIRRPPDMLPNRLAFGLRQMLRPELDYQLGDRAGEPERYLPSMVVV